MLRDTICAISTPLGKSGIGIVRMSGPQSFDILSKIFVPKKKKDLKKAKSHTIHYGFIRDPQNLKIIDEVLVFLMKAPYTYTTEDVVEISCHGGLVPLKETLSLLIREGARLALPGEFTMRAFLNGRIDLTQAEAVLDVIYARTLQSLEISINQLQGKERKFLESLRERLLKILTHLEAVVEFPEDEIDTIDFNKLREDVHRILTEITQVLKSSEEGLIFKEGLNVVIAGRTNVGKSSLLNCLLASERAIVSPLEGTTRDILKEEANIKGVPLNLFDTAGIITPRDLVEKEALKRTQEAIKKANLILLVVDISQELTDKDLFLIEKLKDLPVILVINKIDLPPKADLRFLKERFKEYVFVSCLKKEGIEELKEKMIDFLFKGNFVEPEKIIVSNKRHTELLEKAKICLENFLKDLQSGFSIDFLMLHLKEAVTQIDKITGKIYSEELLENIFSRFCIGK